jgi:hypothetical protein
MPARTRIDQLLPYEQELVAIRRHLHQHPELAFAEYGTSDFVGADGAQGAAPKHHSLHASRRGLIAAA